MIFGILRSIFSKYFCRYKTSFFSNKVVFLKTCRIKLKIVEARIYIRTYKDTGKFLLHLIFGIQRYACWQMYQPYGGKYHTLIEALEAKMAMNTMIWVIRMILELYLGPRQSFESVKSKGYFFWYRRWYPSCWNCLSEIQGGCWWPLDYG